MTTTEKWYTNHRVRSRNDTRVMFDFQQCI